MKTKGFDSLETKLIHSGEHREQHKSVSFPIYQTALHEKLAALKR